MVAPRSPWIALFTRSPQAPPVGVIRGVGLATFALMVAYMVAPGFLAPAIIVNVDSIGAVGRGKDMVNRPVTATIHARGPCPAISNSIRARSKSRHAVNDLSLSSGVAFARKTSASARMAEPKSLPPSPLRWSRHPCDLPTLPALTAGIEQAMVPDSNGPPLQSGIWYPSDAPALGWMHPAFPSLSACIQGQTFGTLMNSSRAPPRRTICAPNAGQSTAVVAHPTQACCARALSAWGQGLSSAFTSRTWSAIPSISVVVPRREGNHPMCQLL